jgi:hypothetical protein
MCTFCKSDKRSEIDKLIMFEGITKAHEIISKDWGWNTTRARLQSHYDNHSAYLKEVKNRLDVEFRERSLKAIDYVQDKSIEAEEVIQDIIQLGGAMIRNGEMEITPQLLTAMIKEQGTRKKTGTLQDLLENLDRKRFGAPKVIEGEVVEDDEEDLEEIRNEIAREKFIDEVEEINALYEQSEE